MGFDVEICEALALGVAADDGVELGVVEELRVVVLVGVAVLDGVPEIVGDGEDDAVKL